MTKTTSIVHDTTPMIALHSVRMKPLAWRKPGNCVRVNYVRVQNLHVYTVSRAR